MIFLQISSDTKYFSFLVRGILCSRVNSCYSILFSNLKQKKYNIISSRVISSHMGPVYFETPYISSYMVPVYIETPYISSHMGYVYTEAPYTTKIEPTNLEA